MRKGGWSAQQHSPVSYDGQVHWLWHAYWGVVEALVIGKRPMHQHWPGGIDICCVGQIQGASSVVC